MAKTKLKPFASRGSSPVRDPSNLFAPVKIEEMQHVFENEKAKIREKEERRESEEK